MAITLDDTTTASVNQKPSAKADEIGKINSGGVFNSTCSNNSTTTTTKKKEKLNKENKELREQRREQRLLRKLSTVSTQHTQNHNSKSSEKLNDNSINIDLNNGYGDEITNQAFVINAPEIQSCSLMTDVNNLSDLTDKINKVSNCDKSEEFIHNQEQESSENITTNSELESLEKNQKSSATIVDTSILNTSEIEFLCKPVLNESVAINYETAATNNVTTTNIVISNSNLINTMPKPSNKTKSNKVNSEVLPNLRIEDVASLQSPVKCDVEEQELRRASKVTCIHTSTIVFATCNI